MPKLITVSIITISLVFFAALALNISPWVRGPSEWRWPYQFIPTFNKLYFPIAVGVLILLLFKFVDSKKIKSKWLPLFTLVFLSFLFQISVVFFSRAGINVLYHRTFDPGLNGYYSAGIAITDPRRFITNYPQIVNSLPMHAKGHPPGGPLSFYFANTLVRNPFWIAITSPFVVSLLSCLAIILVYLISQSFRAAFLTATIPALALFMPLLDLIYPLFGLTAVYLITKHKNFLSGLVFGLGLFFSYSLLPVMAVIFILSKTNFLKFSLGVVVFFLSLNLIFGYDFIKSTLVVISNQAPRSFLPWLIYNPYDFMVFLGLPTAILLWLSNRKFLLLFFSLILTIFSRGEVGRIWLPLMVLATIPAGKYLTEKKFSSKFVMILLALQMIQTLIIQEFWVPLW